MGDKCACSFPPPEGGNMYFRGAWEFCPEYDIGDVVICSGAMYVALKHHAGHDPTDKDNKEYWLKIGNEPPPPPRGRRVIDGGFATTMQNDTYSAREPVDVIDAGGASDRVNVPLI